MERTTGILSPTMGVISTEMYEALLLAHVPEDKARAAAAAVAKTQDLASKSDLLQLQAEMEKRFAEVEKSLAVVKFAVFSGGSIILVLLIKLVFFAVGNGPEFGVQRLCRPNRVAGQSVPAFAPRILQIPPCKCA